jgi:serine/threonine protein kinase
MLGSLSGSDLLNELAHEFAERYRRGERPPIKEYTDRYPELAQEICEIFPTLVMMEQFGSGIDNPEAPTARRARTDEPVPETLGDYRIVREIGRGGMGVVYEAVQESLSRRVALKVLSHHRIAGSIHLRRFEREAKAAALLHHTNIVPVFGVGEHQGVHYYAMQYIEGQSLDTVLAEIDRIRGRSTEDGTVSSGKPDSLAKGLLSHRLQALQTPDELRQTESARPNLPPERSAALLPLPEPGLPAPGPSSSTSKMLGDSEAHYFRSVARLGMQVAEALAYAHQHGVLHRDIKPANLLLDLHGTVWVTDFGLAKAEGSDELTSPGDVVGTLRYMAPERFRGQADARSDVYSLGLTLYEMLTFAPAFVAAHRVEYIHAILHEEPLRPRTLDPRIPPDLETIVLRSIAKNPADRYRTADEMARELGRFVEGRSILSRRASLYERAWRWSRRNRMTAALILLAASLTSLLAIFSTLAAVVFRDQRNAVQAEQDKTRASLLRATKAERDREEELGRSLLAEARAVRFSGRPDSRTAARDTLIRAAQFAHAVNARPDHLAELRDELIAALALDENHPLKTWSGLPVSGDDRAFSAGTDQYVSIESRGSLYVRRISDGSLIRIVGAGRPANRLFIKFVTGGRFVLVLSDWSRYELWDLEQDKIPEAWPGNVSCVSSDALGKHVAALCADGEMRVYDLPPAVESARWQVGFKIPKWMDQNRMCLSQDGRLVAVIGHDEHQVGIYTVADGRVVREFKLPMARVEQSIALNRNGGLLAVAHDRAISVYDMADGERLSLLQGHLSEGIRARFQTDGDLLASSAWDGTSRLWDPIRGRQIVTLEGGPCEWERGGKSLVVNRDHDLVLYGIGAGEERRSIDYRTLGDRAGAALYGPARLAYSRDGQLLAMAIRPEGVRIIRLSDGAALALLPIGVCDEVLFMPGGDLLTFNSRGLCRWPVRLAKSRVLRIGPPEPLGNFMRGPRQINAGLAASGDGRIWALRRFIRGARCFLIVTIRGGGFC